jgi:hypothetical protein
VAPEPVWTQGLEENSSSPYLGSNPDRPARSQTLYRLSYKTYKYNERLGTARSYTSVPDLQCAGNPKIFRPRSDSGDETHPLSQKIVSTLAVEEEVLPT